MWLPYNGKPNQIRVDRENFMKHIVIELEGANELVISLIILLAIMLLNVMKPTHKKIEKRDPRLRIQPLRGGNLL